MINDIKQYSKKLLNINPIDRLLILGLLILPFSISLGPFLPELTLIIMSIFFIFITFKYRLIPKVSFKILFLYTIFCIYLIVRSLLAIDVNLSLESSLFYFRFFFLILIFEYILSKYNFFLKYFFYILTLSCAFIILKQMFLYYSYSINDSLISIFLSSDTLYNYKFNANNRMPSLFTDEVITGSYLSRLFPLILSLSLFVLPKKISSTIYIFLLIFIFGLSIFISGERSAFFNFIFIFSILVIFCQGWRFLGLTFFTIILLFSMIAYNYFDKHKNLFNSDSNIKIIDDTIEELITKIDQKMIKGTISQINLNTNNLLEVYKPHENIYKTSYNIYKDNKIFGVGPKIFRIACSDEAYNKGGGCSTHPHNTLLQLLTETGLLGFLFYFFLVSCCIFMLIKVLICNIFYKNYDYLGNHTIILLASILMNLNPLIPSGNLFNNWLNLLYYLPIGFLIFFLNSKKNV